jgi:hypothetical protein
VVASRHGFLEAEGNKSVLGFRVRVVFIVDISVRWSVTFWASVLYFCLNAVEGVPILVEK